MNSTLDLMRPFKRVGKGLAMGVQAAASSVAALIMRCSLVLGLRSEVRMEFVNWKRKKDCRCQGCANWRMIVQGLRSNEDFKLHDLECVQRYVDWRDVITLNRWNLSRVASLAIMLIVSAINIWALPALVAGAAVVTTEGGNDMLTKYFKGSGYTATWYVGLVDNAQFSAYAIGDTAAKICTSGNVNAPTTNAWAEGTPYSNANRVTWTGGTAASKSIDNSGSVAAFTINATLTVHGGFLISNNTKGGTSGVLFGAGDFSANRSVVSGDTLNVTSTMTV